MSAGPSRTQLAAAVAQAAEATARALVPTIIVSDQGHGVETAGVIRPSPFLTPVDGPDRDEILRRLAIVATLTSLPVWATYLEQLYAALVPSVGPDLAVIACVTVLGYILAYVFRR